MKVKTCCAMEAKMQYLEISSDWMNIFGIAKPKCVKEPAGKCLSRINGIYIIIHPDEQGHNAGHIHARYQDNEVVISIPDGEILGGSIPIKKQREASKWVINHRAFLIKEWNEFTNGVRIPI